MNRTRLGPVAVAVLLALALVPSAPAQYEAGDPRPPAPILAPWMIYVRAFGQEADAGPALALHRRLGPRSDLGLQFDASFNSDHLETDRHVYPQESLEFNDMEDTDGVHVWFHTETRRWTFLSPKVSSWVGLRFSLGYGRGDQDYVIQEQEGEDREERKIVYDWETLDTGLSLTCGVEVEMVRHLAAAAALVPLRYMHHWTRTVTDERHYVDYSFSRDEDWSRSYGFKTSLIASAYLVLRF